MAKRKADEALDALEPAAASIGTASSQPAIHLQQQQQQQQQLPQTLPNRSKRAKTVAEPDNSDSDNDDDDDDDDESNYDSDSSATSVSMAARPAAPNPAAPRSKPRPKNQICTWPNCNKRYNRPTRLESHMRSHRGERPFACTVPGCGKTYIEAKHLSHHVEANHEGKRDHHCPFPDCGRAFFTSTRLSRHVSSHIKAQQFQCKGYAGCKQVFRRRDTLNRHVRQAHLNLPGYTCPETGCPEAFASSGALRNHRKRAHGELKHFCDECKVVIDGQERSLGFTHISELRSHFKTAHMSCSFCAYRCTYPSEMDRHVAMHHSTQTVSDRKTVRCEWPGCDKLFTKKSNMLAHAKSSHGGYRFVCGMVDVSASDGLAAWDNARGCREGFVTKANLESHIRYIHLGHQRTATAASKPKSLVDELAGADDAAKRTLTCDCGRGFIRYHDLQVHLELDHGRPAAAYPVCAPALSEPASAYPEPPSAYPDPAHTYPEPAPAALSSSPTAMYTLPTLLGNDAAKLAGREYDATAAFSAFLSPALTPHGPASFADATGPPQAFAGPSAAAAAAAAAAAVVVDDGMIDSALLMAPEQQQQAPLKHEYLHETQPAVTTPAAAAAAAAQAQAQAHADA